MRLRLLTSAICIVVLEGLLLQLLKAEESDRRRYQRKYGIGRAAEDPLATLVQELFFFLLRFYLSEGLF